MVTEVGSGLLLARHSSVGRGCSSHILARAVSQDAWRTVGWGRADSAARASANEAYDGSGGKSPIQVQEEALERLKQEAAAKLGPLVEEMSARVSQKPQDTSLRIEIGHLLFASGESARAKEHYEMALAFGVADHKTAGLIHLLYASCLSKYEPDMPTPITYDALKALSYEETKPLVLWTGLATDEERTGALATFHLNEVARRLELHIKTSGADLDVLRILRDLYQELGRAKQKGRVDNLIARAEALAKVSVTPSPSVATSQVHKGIDFESRCLRLLTAMGFTVRHTGQTHDGGIDIRAENLEPLKSARVIVQCKDWESAIGEPTLRDLYGLVMSEGVNKGILVTTSRFTDAARRFAEGKPIELIDGDTLAQLEQTYIPPT